MAKAIVQTSVSDPWAKKTLPAVQEILDRKGISNGDVSRGTGLSRTHICRVLSGLRTPSLKTTKKITGYLGITMEQFCQALDLRTGDVK